jgi:hypothetical protein
MYVTFNGKPWKSSSAKSASEKWVNINLDPMAIGEARVSTEQLESLSAELKASGYSPFVGAFGFGGAVSSGYGALGYDSSSAVYYFSPTKRSQAEALTKLAGDKLGYRI